MVLLADNLINVLLLFQLSIKLVYALFHFDEDLGLLAVDLPEPLLHGLFIPDYHAELRRLCEPLRVEPLQLFEAGEGHLEALHEAAAEGLVRVWLWLKLLQRNLPQSLRRPTRLLILASISTVLTAARRVVVL